MSEERFRGASVRTLPRPNKSYGGGPRLRRSRLRDQALGLQQVGLLLAARTGPRVRSPRQAQAPHGGLDLAPKRSPHDHSAEALRSGGPRRMSRLPGRAGRFKDVPARSDDGEDRSPRARDNLWPKRWIHRSPMREGACPFCERTVLVYEEPPRCPLCACPMDEDRMQPFSFPVEDPARRPLARRQDRAAPSADRAEHGERRPPSAPRRSRSAARSTRPSVEERRALGSRAAAPRRAAASTSARRAWRRRSRPSSR